MNSKAAHLLIIEGNISAGKSTLTRELEGSLGYKVFLEPTLSNPYLEKFYKDPKAYALKMQLWLLRNRFRTYVTALRHINETGQGVILDRSVFSDWVFAEKNRLDGNIDQIGFDYYMDLRTQMLQNLPIPSITVYLDVSAQVCYDRVHNLRGRDCESGIPLAYLAGLGNCYTEFTQEMHKMGSYVLTADWNNFGSVQDIANEIAQLRPQTLQRDGLHALLADEDAVLALMQPPSAEPREYAEWYAAEVAQQQWEPDAEYAAIKRMEEDVAADDAENQPNSCVGNAANVAVAVN